MSTRPLWTSSELGSHKELLEEEGRYAELFNLQAMGYQQPEGILYLEKKLPEDPYLNHKSIPFVFFSNTATKAQIEKSYDLGSNGFFIKGKSMEEIKNTLIDIVNYWGRSKTPNKHR